MWAFIVLIELWAAPAHAQEMFKSKRKEKEEMDRAISEQKRLKKLNKRSRLAICASLEQCDCRSRILCKKCSQCH